MREITPAGYSETEYQKNNGFVAPRCYLCKRKKGDDTLIYIKKGDYAKLYKAGLYFTQVEVTKESYPYYEGEVTTVKYLICHECMGLIEALGKKLRFMKFALEEDAK